MKTILAVSLSSLFVFGWGQSQGYAAPDPRDSVIIESKTINAGVGSPAAVVRVYITNKDTLAAVTLTFVEKSVSGGAYMKLATPRNYGGVVNPLISTLQDLTIFAGQRYNNISPDTFVIAAFKTSNANVELPNLTRKALLEMKFDTVQVSAPSGTVQIDSALLVYYAAGTNVNRTVFVRHRAPFSDLDVNFVKGTITVLNGGIEVKSKPPAEWDMNEDEKIDVKDVVLAVDCVFLGEGNCKGATPGDLVELLNRVYLNSPSPLPARL